MPTDKKPRHAHPGQWLTLCAQFPHTVRFGTRLERMCATAASMAVCGAVEYLAVAQMPRRWSRKLQGTLLRRGYRLPGAWHAVPAYGTTSAALCGFRYTREPHRTWTQTMIPRRCHKCQGLIDEFEAHAADPSANSLWAVAAPDVSSREPVAGTYSGSPAPPRGPSPEVQRNGVVPAT